MKSISKYGFCLRKTHGFCPVANSDCLSHLFRFRILQRRDKVASGHMWYLQGTQFSEQGCWYKMGAIKCVDNPQCYALIRARADQWMRTSGIWFGSGCRMQDWWKSTRWHSKWIDSVSRRECSHYPTQVGQQFVVYCNKDCSKDNPCCSFSPFTLKPNHCNSKQWNSEFN